MRFVALALILLSFPLFVALLNRYRDRRDTALFAIGLMTFAFGTLQIDAAFVSWPMWAGIARGILLSPLDTLCWALLLTRKRPTGYVPLTGLLLFYLLPATLSIAVSAVPMASAFVPWQTLRLIVMFWAVAGELQQRPSALPSLMKGLAVGLMVQAGFVLVQKMNGVGQPPGTGSHRNMTGMVVELAIIPLLAAALEGQRSKLVYAGILSGLIVIALGGSRGAMAVVALGVVLLFVVSLIRRPTKHKSKLLGLAVLAGAVIVPLGFATLNDRFGEGGFVTVEEERDAFERAARAMADDNPLGVGANTYVTVSNLQGYAERAGVIWNAGSRSAPVHNAYLLARAETGWLGNIVVILMVAVPLFVGLRVAFGDRKSPFLGVAAGASVVVVMAAVHNNFEWVWFIEEIQRVYFLNLAIIAAAAMTMRERRREARRARRLQREHAPVAA